MSESLEGALSRPERIPRESPATVFSEMGMTANSNLQQVGGLAASDNDFPLRRAISLSPKRSERTC